MMAMMTYNSDDDGDNNNNDYRPVWTIVDDKEMIIQVTMIYLALSLAYHNHYHH